MVVGRYGGSVRCETRPALFLSRRPRRQLWTVQAGVCMVFERRHDRLRRCARAVRARTKPTHTQLVCAGSLALHNQLRLRGARARTRNTARGDIWHAPESVPARCCCP